MVVRARRFPAWRSALALAAPLALASCGGSLSFGFGTGFDDVPPAISVTSNATTVQAGQAVTVVAAAADENGVVDVRFYRDDGGVANLVCTDETEPYQCQITAPADGRSSMAVFARARDPDGNTSQSSALGITITP
jgi:hypothetical protein